MAPRPVPAAQTSIPKLLDAFASEVERCARLTRELLASFPERLELARAVKDCEHEGDRVARELFHALGRDASPKLPFDAREGCAWPRWSTTSSTSSSRPPTRGDSTRSRRPWSRPSCWPTSS